MLLAASVSWIFAFFFDLAAEWFIIYFTEAYAWGITVKSLTLLPGSQFQFPLYECFLVAVYGTIYAFLIKSERDDGRTYVERGLENLPKASRCPLRVFAAIGFAFVPTLIYFSGFATISILGGADSYADLPAYLQYIR